MAAPVSIAFPNGAPRLELRGICKRYPSVLANDLINLRVAPGEIHAVLGENGAGKSTLMKIIYGLVKADSGELLWGGEAVSVTSPAQARRLGIGMVFQHFSLFETLTVVENIALGMTGKPDLATLSAQIVSVSERYGLPVDPDRLVHTMSVGERQRVEIIRALLLNPRLLIMDEPTSVLTPQAVEKLFETLRQLSDDGCSILYISHKLHEIKALCHAATVMRAGRVIGVCDPRQESPRSMAKMMVGADLPVCRPSSIAAATERCLVVDKLTRAADSAFGTALDQVELVVHAGEIVGIAGVSGNGQRELLTALSGETPISENNRIELLGTPVGAADPSMRRRLGLCFVPEERLGRGAVPTLSLAENALLTAHDGDMVQGGLLNFGAITAFTRRCIEEFQVKCGGPNAEARSLSGGNLQKFIIGREVLQKPKVLIVSQPTWGVDVGAAAFIRQTLIDLRNSGTAILVISEELDELFEICDRIAVMAKGRLSKPIPMAETDLTEIGLMMTGLSKRQEGRATQFGSGDRP
jgi:simple sugar transport system ATP-binding protein